MLPLVKTVPHTGQRAAWMTVLARAAAVALLAAAAGAGGFVAGRSVTPVADAPVMASAAPAAAPSKQSPWARYQVSFDPTRSGMTVVRVANSALPPP